MQNYDIKLMKIIQKKMVSTNIKINLSLKRWVKINKLKMSMNSIALQHIYIFYVAEYWSQGINCQCII